MIAISVIMPVLNGAATISRALDSLAAQTMTAFEVFVVNDGSVDETASIVQAAARNDARIRYIELDRNYGVSHARNVALDQAQGTWLALLDADDWFDADRLERLLAAVQDLQADVVMDNLRIVHQTSGRIWGETRFALSGGVSELDPYQLFERDTPFSNFAIGYAQPLFNVAFLRRNNIYYGEDYAFGEDFEFLAQAVLSGAKTYVLPFAGYNYTYQRQPLFARLGMGSKSKRGYHQILVASDRLLEKFGAQMTGKVRRALLRRRQLFKILSVARDIKLLTQKRAWRQVLGAVIRQPSVVPFIVRLLVFRHFSPDFTSL